MNDSSRHSRLRSIVTNRCNIGTFQVNIDGRKGHENFVSNKNMFHTYIPKYVCFKMISHNWLILQVLLMNRNCDAMGQSGVNVIKIITYLSCFHL